MKETIISLVVFFLIFIFIVMFEFIMVGDMVKQELPIETTTTEQDEK
jgi:biopolymer transport protein ExbD